MSIRIPNPAVDPVRFALWTLRNKAAQRRSPLRWASLVTRPLSLSTHGT